MVFFADPPYFGGAEEYIVMLATACPKEYWEAAAMVPADDGGAELARRLEEVGVKARRFERRAWHHPGLARDLRRCFRELHPDVVHLNLPSVYDSCLSMPALAAKLAGCPRVVTTEHLPMVERARRRMVVKIAIAPWIDAIIVHTQKNRQILGSKHHMPMGRMNVIPNGSAESPAMDRDEREAFRHELGLAAGEVGLLVAASLDERKGHRFLFEALAGLPVGTSSWRLILMGKGEEEPNLRALADRLNLSSRVQFLGFRTDAREVIHACDLLVLPSLMETQPLVLTEAMASGLPVIASAIYGIPEIVLEGETGRLVAAADVEALRGALAELLEDEPLRERMGAAGQARYEAEFTLDLMASRTYRVLAGETAARAELAARRN